CLFLLLFPAPASPAICTLSLHDALPILHCRPLSGALFEKLSRGVDITGSRDPRSELHGDRRNGGASERHPGLTVAPDDEIDLHGDRKSTRLNSSHVAISYAVFCLKKKTN